MTEPSPRKYLDRVMDGGAREFYRRLAEGEGAATTGCPSCGSAWFPPRPRCPDCGAELEWVELPRRGRLYAFTTQETALRFSAPAVLALVELGDVVLPGIVAAPYDQLEIGDEVEVEATAEPDLGLALLRFTPTGGASK